MNNFIQQELGLFSLFFAETFFNETFVFFKFLTELLFLTFFDQSYFFYETLFYTFLAKLFCVFDEASEYASGIYFFKRPDRQTYIQTHTYSI